MDFMDENSCQSPRSCEKPPARGPSQRLLAALFGCMAFGGAGMLQVMVMEFVFVLTAYSRVEMRLVLPIFALVALPVGVWIAWWTVRAQSK